MATQKLAISQKMRSLPWIDIGTLAVGSLLALALRLCLVMFESGDFYLFFKEWYQAIQAQGFRSIVTLQYDYTPPYLYLLYIVSALFPKLQPAAALKLPAIVADFFAAYLVYKIVRLRYPIGPAPFFAYFVVLFAPTILLNSAFWGQSESIFTALLILCIYFLLTD